MASVLVRRIRGHHLVLGSFFLLAGCGGVAGFIGTQLAGAVAARTAGRAVGEAIYTDERAAANATDAQLLQLTARKLRLNPSEIVAVSNRDYQSDVRIVTWRATHRNGAIYSCAWGGGVAADPQCQRYYRSGGN